MKDIRARHKENAFRGSGLPEENLLCGIIARAVGDMISSDPNIARKARRWITSNRTRDWSYLWIAEHANLTESAQFIRMLAEILDSGTPAALMVLQELREFFAAPESERPHLRTLKKKLMLIIVGPGAS